MPTAVTETEQARIATGLPLARISVDQYHRMIETGILTEADRVELIEGYLVDKMTKNPPHCVALRLLNNVLTRNVPETHYVATQDPITLDNSEPEPDLTVVSGELKDHVARHPGPQEIALVVEVADSTLAKDRQMTLTYARNRLPVYWIVNLIDETVEVYTKPTGLAQQAKYQQTQVYQRGDMIPCTVLGDTILEISVDSILP